MPSSQGIRMTRQRRVIMEILQENNTHPAADDIYEMVRRRLPRISLGTVYRNLEILSACGMIHKLELSGSQRRFDGDLENHYHVRCVQCDRVDDVAVKPTDVFEETLRDLSDYEIMGHHLEFLGVCPECKKQQIGTSTGIRENRRKE